MPATDSATTRQVGKMTIRVKSDREAEITRDFDAPRRLVWEAISKPEHVRQWWPPPRRDVVSCELDFRPGGAWRYVLRGPDGNEYAFHGQIREIVPPERVVRTFAIEGMPGVVETWTLTERDGKTTLSMTSSYDSAESLQGVLQSGFAAGAAKSHDRLEEYLRTLAQRPAPIDAATPANVTEEVNQ